MDRIRRLMLVVASVAVATWMAAGAVLAADGSVSIANLAFDPATVTVNVGDSVTWTNQDSLPHTATAGDASFDTGSIGAGQTATVTFDTAGTFAYICSIHPQMAGTVVVQGAAATPAPTAAPTTGGGVTITPAPTDTLAATADEDLASTAVAIALAALGVLMLVGTYVADRRFRTRDG
jgi:plastocyanin